MKAPRSFTEKVLALMASNSRLTYREAAAELGRRGLGVQASKRNRIRAREQREIRMGVA